MLTDYSKKCHKKVVEKGFYDKDKTFGELIALIHSELSEALEEFRKGIDFKTVYYENEKPEGIPIELADAILRILDVCGYYDIDIDEALKIKTEYNNTRPYKHGNKRI